MMPRFIVTGTDTGIGKTVFSAALVAALDGVYWKPVQAGLQEETDRETVQRLSGLPAARMLPEAYRLNTPASPHLAAEIDGITIDPAKLVPPTSDRPLVIEGAGGLLTPLTRSLTYIDVFARWKAPVVLCARTALGTINHSLLSIEALRARDIELLGIVFIGEANADSEQIIVAMGQVRRLGRLPHLAALSGDSLKAAFADAIDVSDFLQDATR